jgi:hypothetical protein
MMKEPIVLGRDNLEKNQQGSRVSEPEWGRKTPYFWTTAPHPIRPLQPQSLLRFDPSHSSYSSRQPLFSPLFSSAHSGAVTLVARKRKTDLGEP